MGETSDIRPKGSREVFRGKLLESLVKRSSRRILLEMKQDKKSCAGARRKDEEAEDFSGACAEQKTYYSEH